MLGFDLPRFLGAIVQAAPRAGDVLLAVGCPPQVLLDGALVRLRMSGMERLSPFQTEAIVLHLLLPAPPAVAARVRQEGAAHFAYSVPGVNRFRVAVFSQRGTYAVSLRSIPEQVPILADLALPAAVAEACEERNGIILVNGPAGSGRSTTLAAMINAINQTRPCHIVTVEDPIEFLHRHAAATINQREVGTDTPTLGRGMRDALRQGAHVLMFAEPHDAEQARLVLEAAETGHLVLTTLRGYDTASALLRLLSLFPVDEREDARRRLARVLRVSFTQQLLATRDGRRPIVETWRATRAAAAHLVEGPLDSTTVADLLRDGEGEGTMAFDRALELLVRNEAVDLPAAIAIAVLPRQLELRLLDVQERER